MSASSRMFDIPDPDTRPATQAGAGHMTGEAGYSVQTQLL